MWAVVAASAAYWGLRLFVTPAPVPAHARVADAAPPPRGDLARLLGVDAPPPTAAEAEPPPDARFQLVGVLSPKSPAAAREGVALIAVDGKPPRAFRVGHVVDGAQVLKSVNARGATLGPRDGNAAVSLNLPPLPPAATGTLPPPGAGGAPGGVAMPPPTPPMVGGPVSSHRSGAPSSRRSSGPPQLQDGPDSPSQPPTSTSLPQTDTTR